MNNLKWKRLASLCAGALCTFTFAQAQTVIPDDALLLPELNNRIQVDVKDKNASKKVTDLRSATIFANTLVVVDERDGASYNIIPGDAESMEKRLKTIEGIMPMTYNNTVSQFIDFFLRRRPSFTKEMLEKKDFYFPVFEKYLAKYKMPDELKYLALIESGLNPKAVSRAKAVGLWQFMPVTGREQGLIINDYVDERMHIEKSTDAACRYLRTLYGMFHDWELALAAYNSGPGTVRRALRRSGQTDYWEIHNFIPKDTRTYVPQWTAIAYMMNFNKEHNLFGEKMQHPIASRPMYVNGYFDMKRFAELSMVDYATLQLLNPHIIPDILPPHARNLELNIPLENYAYFEANSKNILAEASTKPYIDNTQLAEAALNTADPMAVATSVVRSSPEARAVSTVEDNPVRLSSPKAVPADRTATKYHKVHSGEHLTMIADKYNVDIDDMKRWNDLRSSKIMVGQRLKVYVKETKSGNREGNAVAVNKNQDKSSKVGSEVKYYTVKPGDTLWSISQRYGGVSINDIKRLNNLNGNTVKVGQRLKIGDKT